MACQNVHRKGKIKSNSKYTKLLPIYILALPCVLFGTPFRTKQTANGIANAQHQIFGPELNNIKLMSFSWRKNSFWISTAEETDGVIVHEHSPFGN